MCRVSKSHLMCPRLRMLKWNRWGISCPYLVFTLWRTTQAVKTSILFFINCIRTGECCFLLQYIREVKQPSVYKNLSKWYKAPQEMLRYRRWESQMFGWADVFCDWFCWQEAVRCGVHRTVHAGEVGPASVVKEVSCPNNNLRHFWTRW